MHKLKYIFSFIIIAVFPVINTFAFEEASIQESIVNMIIRETARSNSYGQKIISLSYIEDVIENKYNNKCN
jgi:hypothetical protein